MLLPKSGIIWLPNDVLQATQYLLPRKVTLRILETINSSFPVTFRIFLHQVYKMFLSMFACLHAPSLLRIQQMEPWDGGYQPSHSPLDCNSLSTLCFGPERPAICLLCLIQRWEIPVHHLADVLSMCDRKTSNSHLNIAGENKRLHIQGQSGLLFLCHYYAQQVISRQEGLSQSCLTAHKLFICLREWNRFGQIPQAL